MRKTGVDELARPVVGSGKPTMIRSFQELREKASEAPSATLAVAGGSDSNVMKAVVLALRDQLIDGAIVTGNREFIFSTLPEDIRGRVDVIDCVDSTECSKMAVSVVKGNNADLLMKGHVDSTSYLKAIVDRQEGIRESDVLSNITVAQMPSLGKLISITDNGIVPTPNLEQKRQIIRNTHTLFAGLGIHSVKVAAVAASEKVSEKLPATVDAAALSAESHSGKLHGFIVDGPFGYDVAVSQSSAKSKGLGHSPVAGDADLLLMPSLDAANAVAKSWKFHGQAETGSIVLGGAIPILLNSRSDGIAKRINAILLAKIQSMGDTISY